MNKNNTEKSPETPVSVAISEGLLKLKKEQPKEGVNLVEITKKLSSKKFGKSKR